MAEEEKSDYQKFIDKNVSSEIEDRRKTLREGKIKPIHLGEKSQGWYTLGGTGKKTLDVDARLDTDLADVVATIIETLIEKGIFERLRDTSHLEQE